MPGHDLSLALLGRLAESLYLVEMARVNFSELKDGRNKIVVDLYLLRIASLQEGYPFIGPPSKRSYVSLKSINATRQSEAVGRLPNPPFQRAPFVVPNLGTQFPERTDCAEPFRLEAGYFRA